VVESIDAHANVDKYADADFFNDFEDDFDDEDLKIPFEDLKQKQ